MICSQPICILRLLALLKPLALAAETYAHTCHIRVVYLVVPSLLTLSPVKSTTIGQITVMPSGRTVASVVMYSRNRLELFISLWNVSLSACVVYPGADFHVFSASHMRCLYLYMLLGYLTNVFMY